MKKKITKYEFKEAWVEHLKSRQKLLLDFQKYGVDLLKAPNSKSPTTTTTAASTSRLTGTFRKLNVD